MHDCPVALRAHREAASLEHIQHWDVFRKDLGGELMKSRLTAKGCEGSVTATVARRGS